MDADKNQGPLAPRLRTVLERMPDRAFAARLERVYVAAASAIARLGHIDLAKHEPATADDTADLSLLEEMAPVMRDTLMDVSTVGTVIRANFPQASAQGRMSGQESASTWREKQAEQVIQENAHRLQQEVASLGERLRRPEVVSDRWNLLATLQAFRARFREVIGDLVFLSAGAFDEVSRQEVVPGFPEDLRSAINLRATLSDLIRVIQARLVKVREAESQDIQWNAQQLDKVLDSFARTGAYRSMRAQDKREVIGFRQKVTAYASEPNLPKSDLESAVAGFAGFAVSLAQVNNREMLISHDREAWAACSVKLERAEALVGHDPVSCAQVFTEACELAQTLYGRDPSLDGFLRAVRKTPPITLPGSALVGEMNRLRELLAGLPTT